MKNSGVFQVLKKDEKFVISYVEKGEITYLSLYSFERYPDALEYKDNHLTELDEFVTNMKAEATKREEERIAALKEAEAKKKEEEEAKAKELEEKKAQKEQKKKERKERKEKAKKYLPKFLKGMAIFMAGVIAAISCFFAAKAIKKNINNTQNDNKKPTSSFTDTTTPTNPITNGMENIITQSQSYSSENFESMVATFASQYGTKNIAVTTEDLIKFSAILNINGLAEENKEFAKELFSNENADEFLNDAAKVIGITDMYNSNIWEKEKSAENFIWLSEAIPSGTVQKEEMLLIEAYVRRIARASANNDKELVNKLIGDLVSDLTLPEGRLNAMDDGLEFAAQTYFSTITSSIAVNHIEERYSNYFAVRSSSEQNVSNIFSIYDSCVKENVKTRTK